MKTQYSFCKKINKYIKKYCTICGSHKCIVHARAKQSDKMHDVLMFGVKIAIFGRFTRNKLPVITNVISHSKKFIAYFPILLKTIFIYNSYTIYDLRCSSSLKRFFTKTTMLAQPACAPCRVGAISLFHSFQNLFLAAALSSSGLLTVLCKFCLQPAGSIGKKRTNSKAWFSLFRCEYPQCTLMSLALQKSGEVLGENTDRDIFSLSCTSKVRNYGNVRRETRCNNADLTLEFRYRTPPRWNSTADIILKSFGWKRFKKFRVF